MIRMFFKLAFSLTGWSVLGDLPAGVKKCILIVAPHTSNWDVILGICTRNIQGFEAHFLAKNELFKNPFMRWVITKLGGIPVDRGNRNSKVVESAVRHFEERDNLIITIAPEGTRTEVKEWKTGFYRIADQAKVPIVMAGFDYKRKVVEFLGRFETTGNMKSDIKDMQKLYAHITDRYS